VGVAATSRPDAIPARADEDVVRLIAAKKHEPGVAAVEWRLKAYRHWLT